MQVKGSRVLVLGGWGLVGMAICHKLMEYKPAALIVTSLRQSEAEDAVNQLRKEYSDSNPEMFIPWWGNIFTRKEWKDTDWFSIISDGVKRIRAVKDIFDELSSEILQASALNALIEETKPDIIIDCINTATAIAYLDIYTSTNGIIQEISEDNLKIESVEKLMASSYIPQLIRHIQILNKSMHDYGTKLYLKVGTSGTGGMGMNIPYTHSEERPSRVLLSKTAVAGAQTLLLFLLARTPGGPIIKEVKPTAAIAWKRIAYDTIYKKGQPIKLVDLAVENAKSAIDTFKFEDFGDIIETGEPLKSVFIDTGENGIFSRGEFMAISSLGQMEIITPEEIANYVVYEVDGGNSGHDVIQGLDSFTLGPTYRGGMLQQKAIEKIDQLSKIHNDESTAFELLGPPRLSKLLYEANILKHIAGTMENTLNFHAETLSQKAFELIQSNIKIRQSILSIGLAILLPDGKSYLRGKQVKIPVRRGKAELEMTQENINQWCYEGWVDLRVENMASWLKRINNIKMQSDSIPAYDTSSRFTYNSDYWDNFDGFDEGKIAGWIFEYEDEGWRFKR